MSSLPPDTLARIPLPARPQPVFGLDLQCRYYSARTGGDFFDALTLGPHVVFLLTDIAGSRTDAHTIAAAIQDTFRRRAPEIFGTSGINLMDAITTLALDINHTLTTVSHGPRFSPTFLACFDLPLGILAYINAGGQVAILRDTDGTRVLQTASMPLGLFTHLTFEPAIQAFEPGAQLLLVTKGIIEARRGRTHFGVERLIHMLESSTAVSAETLSQATVEEANQFRSRSWHLPHVSFMKPRHVEDLTAAVLLRPR
jgi:serine phosphatase RsbU (regulator of sigma subunit)